ncbi:MAG TPA: cupin domain-containing protein [Pirellulales bacterium]|nr:cupin domain-containing protein [Pirellulales bacterium]
MAMQHRWPAVAELCRNLEAVFHCPVHANLYLTPPGSQGFAAHFDTHEVLVLQLEGVKHWRMFGAAEELPLATDSVPLTKKPSKPSREVTLHAGDLLYIPRGHIHEASTSDASSLHLTVGVNVYRWADLMRHALAFISRHELSLRRSIPGGALPGDKSEIKRQFQEIVGRLASCLATDVVFDHALESLADQFLGQLEMLPCGQFDRHDNCQVTLDSVVERNLRAVCRIVEGEEGVAIAFPGNRVAGPHRIASALRFVAAATRFAVRELPDDVSDEGKLVLVRRLIREGLLNIVGRPVEFDLSGANLLEENHASDATTRQLAKAVGHAGSQGLVG